MKILVAVFLGLLCLKGSHGFFGIKVTGVGFEADIKTTVTPLATGITALQKALGDLLTAVNAQVTIEGIDQLLVRKDVDNFVSYLKFLGLVTADLLKLSADSSLTVPRVFALLISDSTAVAKLYMDSGLEASATNLDMIFKTTLKDQVTIIKTAMESLGAALPNIQTSLQKIHGSAIPLTAAIVSTKIDAMGVADTKTALSSTKTAISIITTKVSSLTMTIMAENMVSAAVMKPFAGIMTSLSATITTISTEVAKQADTLKKSMATNLMTLNTAISGFTTKLQAMYTDTIVPPVMAETIKACDEYGIAVSTGMKSISAGFSTEINILLDPMAEEGNLYVTDIKNVMDIVQVDAADLVTSLMTSLKANTVSSRTCVMKTLPALSTILTVAVSQFDSCLKVVLPTFTVPEKIAEDSFKILSKKAVDYMSQMAVCMTPTTGTTNQRKVIVTCLKDFNAKLATEAMPDMGAMKIVKDTIKIFTSDYTAAESEYKGCISAASSIVKKSAEAYKTSLETCI